MKKISIPSRALLAVIALVAGISTVLPAATTANAASAAAIADAKLLASRCVTTTVVGHRGTVSAGVHENTLPAFKRAIADGAKVIEFDIHRTKDGQWVIAHDKKIKGKTISKTKYKTLKKIQPSLLTYRQAMNYLRTTNVRVSVEFKPTSVKAGSMRYVAKVIKQYKMTSRVEIASFSDKVLKKFRSAKSVKKYSAGIRTTYNINKKSTLNKSKATIKKFASTVVVRKDLITSSAQVAAFKKAGIGVYVYTSNTASEWAKLNRLAVSGIITDYAGSYKNWCKSIVIPTPTPAPVTPPPVTPTPTPTCEEVDVSLCA